MFYFREHLSFVVCVLHLLHFDDLRLFEDLDRVKTLIVI